MIRALHRWPGLLALALVTVLTLSGAALSVFPAAERIAAPQAEAGLTVGQPSRTRIQAAYPGVEQIRRAPSGRITAYWFDQGTPGAAVIDPATGQGVASADPNQTQRWLTNLHRSLFLGDGGRIAMAVGAAAMLVLSLSRYPAGRAARGRLAALVRAAARTACWPAACRDRPHRGGRPCPVVHHRPVDDGVHLRSASRWRRRRPCRSR